MGQEARKRLLREVEDFTERAAPEGLGVDDFMQVHLVAAARAALALYAREAATVARGTYSRKAHPGDRIRKLWDLRIRRMSTAFGVVDRKIRDEGSLSVPEITEAAWKELGTVR